VPRPSPSTLPRPIHSRALHAESERALLPPPLDDSSPRTQLERILNSRTFTGAHRSQLFLRYIVEHALAHPDAPLKEYSIACDVFGRGAYDPAVNNSVRVEAGRLRSRLLEYYASEGHADPLLIEVPRGAYRAIIRPRQPIIAPAVRPLPFVPAAAARTPAPRPHHHWAIAAAFILGALLGYRASR
jgi:hypothetical protein